MSNFSKFNRHETLTCKDLDTLLQIVRSRILADQSSIKNSIYGLMDGYFYYDNISSFIESIDSKIENNIAQFRDEEINLINDFKNIIEVIENKIFVSQL